MDIYDWFLVVLAHFVSKSEFYTFFGKQTDYPEHTALFYRECLSTRDYEDLSRDELPTIDIIESYKKSIYRAMIKFLLRDKTVTTVCDMIVKILHERSYITQEFVVESSWKPNWFFVKNIKPNQIGLRMVTRWMNSIMDRIEKDDKVAPVMFYFVFCGTNLIESFLHTWYNIERSHYRTNRALIKHPDFRHIIKYSNHVTRIGKTGVDTLRIGWIADLYEIIETRYPVQVGRHTKPALRESDDDDELAHEAY